MQKIEKITNFSFWENDTFFNNVDLIVVGSGIVGLNAAISYKLKHKNAKVLVLEKGILPQGASTKNAGFACFGSVSELIDDLKTTNSETVWQTVEMRIKGLQLLRKRLGDKNLDYKEFGGYELFDGDDLFETCDYTITEFNNIIEQFIKSKNTYSVQNKKIKKFGFKNVKGLIFNKKEGQVDTGKMMFNLLKLAAVNNITILNSINVLQILDAKLNVVLNTTIGDIKTKQVIICTNGFAKTLIADVDLKPARAQVLITKPINNLKIKGTFHYNEGYNYFRNIGNRILLGGGRNLDFERETTTEFDLNEKIQTHLIHLLKTIILPTTPFEIEQQWTGIMGIGSEKKPIIKHLSPNVVCAVRMGGMGVAIGTLVGELAVKELEN